MRHKKWEVFMRSKVDFLAHIEESLLMTCLGTVLWSNSVLSILNNEWLVKCSNENNRFEKNVFSETPAQLSNSGPNIPPEIMWGSVSKDTSTHRRTRRESNLQSSDQRSTVLPLHHGLASVPKLPKKSIIVFYCFQWHGGQEVKSHRLPDESANCIHHNSAQLELLGRRYQKSRLQCGTPPSGNTFS